MDYYGDNAPHCCAWLRELIKAGHLPEGEVDEQDIQDTDGRYLRQFRRVHLFAGIGGWAHALRLAGWGDDVPVWTGSAPCQPFSAAGKRKGEADDRHLWPVLFRLIRKCRPPVFFGEQVASADGYRWLSRVRHDLETAGYAVGCADLPACSQGSPIIRQRLWFVASAGQQPSRQLQRFGEEPGTDRSQANGQPGRRSESGGVGGADGKPSRQGHQDGSGSDQGSDAEPRPGPGGDGKSCLLERPDSKRRQAGTGAGSRPESFWASYEIAQCLDGKARRIEPGSSPLATGLSARVGRLRGYGNSIVPQVAAAFIRAYLEC